MREYLNMKGHLYSVCSLPCVRVNESTQIRIKNKAIIIHLHDKLSFLLSIFF